MIKSFLYKNWLIIMTLTIILTNSQLVSGQATKEQSVPISENINKIIQTSCMPCHGSEGRPMSVDKLNFSKWNDYDDTTQAEKASKVCSTITKGSMPPKFIRESRPEIVPSKEQVDVICKWAESFKPKEGNK